MKQVLLALLTLSGTTFAMGLEALQGDYRLQLYFGDSTPFQDDLKIERSPFGAPSGTMHVPNDFDGKIENIVEIGTQVEFDLLVPKNATRPEMVFHYTAFVLYPAADNLAGFVTLEKSDGVATVGHPYVGSFVAFRKK